jgi:predicted component of type VI protein secretion system
MPPARSDAVLSSIFDRLTDGGTPSQGPSAYISRDQFLKTVRRDLLWLLKTETSSPGRVILRDSGNSDSKPAVDAYGEPQPETSLAEFPMASTSVLAYGFPLARGEMELNSTGLELGKTLERVIRNFEPRLDPKTLRVIVTRKAAAADRDEDDPDVFVFSIEIKGKVWINSVPQDLALQAYYTPAFAQWRIEGAANGA